MTSLDMLVLDMRDIMELSYILYSENDVQSLCGIYDLLKERLKKFYEECFLCDFEVLNDSLFYAKSLLNAYQGDHLLEKMAVGIIEYVKTVRDDIYELPIIKK